METLASVSVELSRNDHKGGVWVGTPREGEVAGYWIVSLLEEELEGGSGHIRVICHFGSCIVFCLFTTTISLVCHDVGGYFSSQTPPFPDPSSLVR